MCYSSTQTITVAGGGTKFTVRFQNLSQSATGSFMFELKEKNPIDDITVEIYGMHGKKCGLKIWAGNANINSRFQVSRLGYILYG